MLMADFILSARTMNLDGLRSSWVRKLAIYTLATAGRKLSRKQGESKRGKRSFVLVGRVSDQVEFDIFHVEAQTVDYFKQQYQHVERIEEQRLRFGAVVLQKIERDPPAFIQGDDLDSPRKLPRFDPSSTEPLSPVTCLYQ
jgi:hypothetical protein